ncbi:MAG: 2-C-methyl-D-erythritol 4-phosphate cytidylyltransferase [Thermocrispum sp.]
MPDPDGRQKVVALVPAAGRGERLGADEPKALVGVGGEPLVRRAVRGLLASGVVDFVVVAASSELLGNFAVCLAEFGERCQIVPGGAERGSSVRNALAAVEPGSVEFVLVHDAARAFTPVGVIRAVVDGLAAGADAVVPGLPVTDTVKEVDDAGTVTGTVARESLRLIQTPQGFTESVLRRAYELRTGAVTDDSRLAELLGVEVRTVLGHPHAMKITTPFDLLVAESILAAGP